MALRTKPGPFGSFFGNAIEAKNTRRHTDAGARSRPHARVFGFGFSKTILVHGTSATRRMPGSHSKTYGLGDSKSGKS